MTTFSAPSPGVGPSDGVVLRAAVAAHLGRYRGASRQHIEYDLQVFLRWCTGQDLDPLSTERADIERYVRWLQDIRRYQPSTVSRRLSVVVGFYRTCVIDHLLPHSPADYVRRPTVPPESPTLGLGHLQFEALITTARLSPNPNDFALIALLGLLGLRIFEACGANIADLGEEHGHRVLRVRGKGGKVVLVPLPPAVARAIDHAADDRDGGPILRNTLGNRMDRHAATRRLKHLAETAGIRMPRMHPHMLRHTFVTTMLDAGVSLRDVQVAARHADPRTTMRYDRARKNLDRHPNYILAAFMASGTQPSRTRHFAELSVSYIHPKHDSLSSMEYGRGVTMPSETELSGELLLVAIVEMSPGQAAAGQRYEDTVLGLLGRHGGSVERRMRGTDSATEVQLIRFRSRAGYESFMVDPNRLGYRDGIGDAAPTTRVIEVRDL